MDKIIRMRDFKRNLSVESEADMSGDEYSDTLQDHVYNAAAEDRLIKGIFESAHVLERCPEIVEVCILPCGSKKAISTDIQHKLIRAFCLEHDIKIIELASAYFSDMIKAQRTKTPDSSDMDCVLITSKTFTEDIEIDGKENNENEKFG